MRARVPAISETLSAEITRVIQAVRKLSLIKLPALPKRLTGLRRLLP